jgi:hypothetical protein
MKRKLSSGAEAQFYSMWLTPGLKSRPPKESARGVLFGQVPLFAELALLTHCW